MSVFLPMSCHGCMLKIADGTSKIISGTEKCIMPIDKCMWKYPSDVPNGMKMRSKVNNKPTAGYREVDKYFAAKNFDGSWEKKIFFTDPKSIILTE